MTEAINAMVATAAPAGGGPLGVSANRKPAAGVAATPVAADIRVTRADADEDLPGTVAEAVEALERFAADAGAELSFRVDDELGRVIVTVLDRRDGTVLRQIPSEEALHIARMLAEKRATFVEAVA